MMDDQNPDEMEAWMKMWQANLAWTEELREDFARRKRRESWAFWGGLAVLVACGVLLALLPRQPGMIWFLKIGVTWVMLASAIYTVVLNHVRRRTEAPLSPSGYLEKCRHNLMLQEREVSWGHKMWPGMLLVLFLSLAMLWMRAPLWKFLVVTFGIAAPGYTFAWWVMFVWGPRRVREESARLQELERSMRDDPPFG